MAEELTLGNASDLEIEGAKLMRDTGGDISKAPPGVQLAADIFLNTLSSTISEMQNAKDKATRGKLMKDIETMINANPHLSIFYDSWNARREIEQMNKALKK